MCTGLPCNPADMQIASFASGPAAVANSGYVCNPPNFTFGISGFVNCFDINGNNCATAFSSRTVTITA